MKNIFNPTDMTEILNRIDRLSPLSQPLWGKMNVTQMLAHNSAFQDIASGITNLPRGWLGMVVGRFARPVLYNEKPVPRNMSSIPEILIADPRDFETEREQLKEKIILFQQNGTEKCTSHPHPFFGKLTPEQWGKGIYKHLDHHLKQFGV
ncbi:hypothetical protein PVOR_16394 [Paenibacillus vortex V453]|uniref:DUF1569 domain-containing protein n=1 Tax=Paenibacillus vortex V453 TaxID=715225 RepID=A0A2R9SUB9_9BACL|nr:MULTISPECIES: DUF1569 domain-containing protein [Paenibacillus]AWP27934.1 hypothetical protein B9D94_15465 [Paenibacillus sp. Cedars]EFU40932.1 hypothetical protein PVOR_16394 [Paenibacillus vortex V453]MPY17292.1 DUF1569 domain-containing protein [Paenibacillus glucanolyticus]